MSLLTAGLKRIAPFIYLLALLLIFYLVFNLHHQWFGLSLIVRIYIFLFCFYMIFIFSSVNIDLYEEEYRHRYGRQGEQILFLKARVAPLFIIYVITVLFVIIDGMGGPDWPWAPLMNILRGSSSNLIVYSLFLLFVLKLKKDPLVTIPIFLALCVAYFYLDALISSALAHGPVVQLIMIVKLLVFYFFLFVEFYKRRNLYKLLTTAVVVSAVTYCLYLSATMLIFAHSGEESYAKKESGLQLLRLGWRYPLGDLKKHVLLRPDPGFFKTVANYARDYHVELEYSDDQWQGLLLSGPVGTADLISERVVAGGRAATLSREKIFSFALKKSMEPDSGLDDAQNFIKLAALHLPGHEAEFEKMLQGANRRFISWACAVMAETKDVRFIPALVRYLTDIDPGVSESAYHALSRITGADPQEKFDSRINDTRVVVYFMDYFSRNRTVR